MFRSEFSSSVHHWFLMYCPSTDPQDKVKGDFIFWFHEPRLLWTRELHSDFQVFVLMICSHAYNMHVFRVYTNTNQCLCSYVNQLVLSCDNLYLILNKLATKNCIFYKCEEWQNNTFDFMNWTVSHSMKCMADLFKIILFLASYFFQNCILRIEL